MGNIINNYGQTRGRACPVQYNWECLLLHVVETGREFNNLFGGGGGEFSNAQSAANSSRRIYKKRCDPHIDRVYVVVLSIRAVTSIAGGSGVSRLSLCVGGVH